MNTIKIYVKQSGSFAELKKNFSLYVGSYQNKLVRVYVPKTILYESQDNSLSNAVKIGGIIINDKDETITTKAFYLDYVGEEIVEGVDYSIYELPLPQEFCVYEGNQTILINVVSIANDNKVVEIVTTQTAKLPIEASSRLNDTEVIAPTELEKINGHLGNIDADLINKQTQLDDLENRVTQNRVDIDFHDTTIQDNTQRIEQLEQTSINGFNYIGEYPTQDIFPDESELTQFVEDKKGRLPNSGDTIKFTLKIDGATDKNYTYIFNGLNWGEPIEELPLEPADNSTLGSMQGTFNDDINVQTNISNGKIVDILTKDNSGVHTSIYTRLNTLNDKQDKIIDGNIVVAKAKSAVNDSEGNNIALTYEKAGTSYTKEQSDNRYLPIAFSNKYYYAKDGIVDNIPTTPPDGKQFEIKADNIGDIEIFGLSAMLEGVFNFTKETSDNSTIWLEMSRDCTLEFRLSTSGVMENVSKLLAVDLSGEVNFTANQIKAINFQTIYNLLGNEEYKLKDGEIFKKLDVIKKDSEPLTISVYSNSDYASTFNLATQKITFNVNYINGKKKINILANEWTDNGDGTYKVVIEPNRHEQAPSNEYGLDLQFKNSANTVQRIDFTPQISDDGIITITSYEAIDCELLIWNAITNEEKGIKNLENPTTLIGIDYTQIGAIKITQTEAPTYLNLEPPKNVSYYYSCFVANDYLSTNQIIVNNETIEIGQGLKFKWIGTVWAKDDMPDKTSEITDDLNNRPLNETLKGITDKANKNGSNIQVEVWQNILGLNDKLNNKSVELKEGLAVDNLIDFFRHFYDLRKGLNDTWEFEVGEGKNENIMNIFGFPYGESPTNSAELIVKRIATSGIGYTLELTFASKKSNTTHTAFVRGWIISGTSYDKYIHFTGWRNARGGQWVDEVNGEVTLTDTNELVLNIGEFKNPYNNFLIAEVTKNNHSYNAFLMLSITAPNVGETTIKLDNEDVYVKLDYNAKTFTISKTSSGEETLKVHLYEKLI